MSSKYSVEQMNRFADLLESIGFIVPDSDEWSYSIGQMSQLAKALKLEEFTPEDITKLGQFKNLAAIKQMLYGYAKIVQVLHVIDCDADPFIPAGGEVTEHRKGGQLEWGAEKISLYLSEFQKNGKYIDGTKLRKELEGLPVFNANVLDYLLAHPELIPEEWKGKSIFFWGTIYRNPDGFSYIRHLYWDDVQWDWFYYWFASNFGSDGPAALLA